MMTRYLDRNDNNVNRPWPASPFVYPLNNPPRTDWALVARVMFFGGIMLAGLAAIIIGVASYLR
jgi:hypothetical protein